MVDASAAVRRARIEDVISAPTRPAAAAVTVASRDGLTAYAEVCAEGVVSPAQSAAWVETWVAKTKADYFVTTIHVDGVAVLALALEVVAAGPFRIARFMGGSHANGNFPPANRDWLSGPARLDAGTLRKAIRAARPDVDVVELERLVFRQHGVENPLTVFPHSQSPDPALAADLTGGIDALLERLGDKRKRKKNTRQLRRFEAAGGFRRFEARTQAEVDGLLGTFFALKEESLRAKGIANSFGAPEVQAFFRALFIRSLREAKPGFVLYGLEIGGKTRAVTAMSRCGGRLIFEFGAFAQDELAFLSPGEFLTFENIVAASRDGVQIYDFSVGDEPYKRTWCDLETHHFDVLIPLTLKGRLFAAGLRARNRLKGAVKRNAFVWEAFKKLRKSTVGKPVPEDG